MLSYSTVGGDYGSKVFHDLVPALAHTGAEEQYQCLRHGSEIYVPALIRVEAGEPECLGECDGKDQEENEPCSKQIGDGRQTCGCGLEKLVQMVVSRNQEEDD